MPYHFRILDTYAIEIWSEISSKIDLTFEKQGENGNVMGKHFHSGVSTPKMKFLQYKVTDNLLLHHFRNYKV